jgi:hypothetical protein
MWNQQSVSKARSFVEVAELPEPPAINFDIPKAAGPALDAGKDQAAVVGREVIAFVKGVTPEQRADIVNASLWRSWWRRKRCQARRRSAV